MLHRFSKAVHPTFVLLSAPMLLVLSAALAEAQLRPLDALEWAVFEPETSLAARAGAGVYHRQTASLAGAQGRLTEWGSFAVALRTGRVSLEAAGTVVRTFLDQTAVNEPDAAVRVGFGGRRRDTGDYRVATAVLLTPPGARSAAVLRFGTRLPTTDNTIGLERDQTDFFATLAGRLGVGPIMVSGEAGVGIHGTREPEYEQSDVLAYAAGTEYTRGPVLLSLGVVGQKDGLQGRIVRGNEDLGELRLGVRLGTREWVQLSGVVGYEEVSPATGLQVAVGLRR